MHALRDSRRDGSGLWRVPGARVLLSRANRRRPARAHEAREWWTSFFDRRYLQEYGPLFAAETDRREVGRLVDVLGLPVGARVLDAACGQGRHSALLAEAGFEVDGVDYSPALLAEARARSTRGTTRFTRADMRRLRPAWTSTFDAVVNLSTSFGFFQQPSDDVAALAEFARVLRPGGVLVWQGASRDGVVARFLSRDWWTTSDGTMIAQERTFDPLSGVMTVTSEWRGREGQQRRLHHLRLYTATRLAELMAEHGLIVEGSWDGWTTRPLRRTSTEMLLLARKQGA